MQKNVKLRLWSRVGKKREHGNHSLQLKQRLVESGSNKNEELTRVSKSRTDCLENMQDTAEFIAAGKATELSIVTFLFFLFVSAFILSTSLTF